MRNKINFITGENYNLAELFSGARKIIIPDLQRDYCWGDSIHTNEKKELVTDFILNLFEQYEEKLFQHQLSLGLIYGYESPENHIQLCDGQQRITTLYLLLGFLNRKTKNAFRSHLLPDQAFIDDVPEPYLHYAIRESSLYFMSDLVRDFFLTNIREDSVEKICEKPWFFNEYKSDPTICSMLKTLQIIENLLSDKTDDWCLRFGLFLLSQLTFLYYDMGNRKNGEETFVVINTTGEPLSATQNLKPLICNHKINCEYKRNNGNGQEISASVDWENIETWFWKNRNVNNSNDTADAGFNEFLRWVTILEEQDEESIKRILKDGIYTFPIDKISFQIIYDYWEIVVFLTQKWEKHLAFNRDILSPAEINIDNNQKRKMLKQVDCFLLLPLIAYCYKNKVKNNDRNLLRFYKFISNVRRIDNVTKAVNDVFIDIMYIAKNYTDVIDAREDDKISATILSKEEKRKMQILYDCSSDSSNREKIEEAFWDAQSNEFWRGEINVLLNWASTDDLFSLEEFVKIKQKFNIVFTEGKSAGWTKDIVRRALLVRITDSYPITLNASGSYLSLGYHSSEWNQLFKNKEVEIKQFILDITSGPSDFVEKCNQFITNSQSISTWYDLIQEYYMLDYADTKRIYYDERFGYMLVKSSWAKPLAIKNLYAFHYLKDHITLPNSQYEFSYYTPRDWNSCAYLKQNDLHICLELRYHRMGDNKSECWVLNITKSDECTIWDKIQNYASKLGFTITDDISYCKEIQFNDEQLTNEVNRFIKECENLSNSK